MTTPAPSLDRVIFFTSLLLIGTGLVMTYSASAAVAQRSYHDPTYFFKKQLIWVAIGSLSMLAVYNLPYQSIAALGYLGLFSAIILSALVLFPDIGVSVNGARRWLRLGSFTFQPSEAVKLLLIVYLSKTFARKQEHIQKFAYTFLPFLVVLGGVIMLLLQEPDLGNSVILALVCFSLSYIAGVKVRYLLLACGGTIPLLYWVISKNGYMGYRLHSYLQAWHDPAQASYQVVQSLYAFGLGGVTGQGIGLGVQKIRFLPEPHTDFIFAVIGEELGLIGCLAVIVLFFLLLARGLQIAWQCQEPFGRYLAAGVSIMLGLHALTNMAVTVGLLPPKGIPLPFISYGGSSLVVSMTAIGILLSVSRQTQAANMPQPTKRTRKRGS